MANTSSTTKSLCATDAGCLVYGTAYNLLSTSADAQTQLNFDTCQMLDVAAARDKGFITEDERQLLYYDPAARLTNKETDAMNLFGRPICDTHGKSVGHLIKGWVEGSTLRVLGRISDKEVAGKVRGGDYGSFSVKYRFIRDRTTNTIHGKDIEEISVCKEPFFDGCAIEIAAAKFQPTRRQSSQPEDNNRQATIAVIGAQKGPSSPDCGQNAFLTSIISRSYVPASIVFPCGTVANGGDQPSGTKKSISPQYITSKEEIVIDCGKPSDMSDKMNVDAPSSTETATQAANASTPGIDPAKTREVLTKLAEAEEEKNRMAQENKKLREANSAWEKLNQEQRQAYAEKQKPLLDTVMTELAKQNGYEDASQLPERTTKLLSSIFTEPDFESVSKGLIGVINNAKEAGEKQLTLQSQLEKASKENEEILKERVRQVTSQKDKSPSASDLWSTRSATSNSAPITGGKRAAEGEVAADSYLPQGVEVAASKRRRTDGISSTIFTPAKQLQDNPVWQLVQQMPFIPPNEDIREYL